MPLGRAFERILRRFFRLPIVLWLQGVGLGRSFLLFSYPIQLTGPQFQGHGFPIPQTITTFAR